MELSKQMLMESSGAGCFESFLGLLSVMTQWPAESGCSLQQSAVTPLQHHLKKVLAVMSNTCYIIFHGSWRMWANGQLKMQSPLTVTSAGQPCCRTADVIISGGWETVGWGQYLKRLFESLHSSFDAEERKNWSWGVPPAGRYESGNPSGQESPVPTRED